MYTTLIMGSFKRPLLSTDQIIARYRDGESAGLIALRCRVPSYYITAVLTEAGIRLRGPAEALRVALKDQFASTRRMQARRGRV